MTLQRDKVLEVICPRLISLIVKHWKDISQMFLKMHSWNESSFNQRHNTVISFLFLSSAEFVNVQHICYAYQPLFLNSFYMGQSWSLFDLFSSFSRHISNFKLNIVDVVLGNWIQAAGCKAQTDTLSNGGLKSYNTIKCVKYVFQMCYFNLLLMQ